MFPEIPSNRRIIAIQQADGRRRNIVLPAKWSDKRRRDYRDWDGLSPDEKKHVVRSITDFSYFHHHVFLPYFCNSESKPWPETLWPYLNEICRDYQRHLHPDLVPFDVYDDEWEKGIWRVCRVAPNRCLKTATTCYSFSLWLLGCNTEARIIIATASKTLGESRISVVKGNILNNRAYKGVFGELFREKSGQRWAVDVIDVFGRKREADHSMAIYGWDGGVEGIGADVGIADDVQNFKNSGTPEMRYKQYTWLQQAFEKRLDTTARLLLLIQTRHAVDDFAGHAQNLANKGGTWDYKEYPAIFLREDGSGGWPPNPDELVDPDLPDPQRWDIENLKDPDEWRSRLLADGVLPLEMLIDEWKPVFGRGAFFKTRMNSIYDPENKWFPRQTLEEFARADGGIRQDGEVRPRLVCWDVEIGIPQPGTEIHEVYERANISIDRRVVSIDTAATAPKSGTNPDYTVIQLWGMDASRHVRVLLDQFRLRTSSPKTFRDKLSRYLHAYRPHFTLLETNAMARWVGDDTQRELGWPITPYHRGKDAITDVEAFKTLIESGLLLYPWGDGRSVAKMKQFEDELDAYPSSGEHDDTLIAAVQAQSKLRPKGLTVAKVHTVGAGSRRETVARESNGLEGVAEEVARVLKVAGEVLAYAKRTAAAS